MDGSIFSLEGTEDYFDFLADVPPLFGDASFDLRLDLGYLDVPDSSGFSDLPPVSTDFDMGFEVIPSIHPSFEMDDNLLALGIFGGLEETTESQQSIQPSLLTSAKSQPPKDNFGLHDTQQENDNLSKRKRPWDDSLVVFSADGGNHVPRRQRKAYSEMRKKEVARNRFIGACAQCKLRRGPCNFGIPCDHCIKRVGSAALAQEICYRRSLVNTRFDKIDMFEISIQMKRLQGYMATCNKTSSQDIWIGYEPFNNDDLSQAFLKVPVLEFQNAGDITMSYITATYHGCEYIAYQGPPLLIAPDRLPTTEWLMNVLDCRTFRRARVKRLELLALL